MAVRSHGGDGDSTHNPFVGNDPALGLNDAVLNQWEDWFSQMDAAGITIFFFFYDDSARIWGDRGDGVQPEETPFIGALVDRFEHHLYLIWVVAEEYEEQWTQAEASQLSAIIRAADDHDHPIAVHQLGGLEFGFPDDPAVDQFAIQLVNADLSLMSPAPSLPQGSTDYVLADEGATYLASARGPGDLGLANLPAGQTAERWLDVVTGTVVERVTQIAGGTVFFERPVGIGQEVALYLDFTGVELFSDGFETGDTSAWSAVVP